jgi:hypothetical protein
MTPQRVFQQPANLEISKKPFPSKISDDYRRGWKGVSRENPPEIQDISVAHPGGFI